MLIEDGSGKNPIVATTADAELKVQARIITQMGVMSMLKSAAFSWYSAYAATAGQYVISIKNTDPTKKLVIANMSLGANGVGLFTVEKVTAGTPAGTSIVATNLKLSSGLLASATAFGNASVTGITGSSIICGHYVPSSSQIYHDTEDAVILQTNDTIAIKISTSVTVAVAVHGYYID